MYYIRVEITNLENILKEFSPSVSKKTSDNGKRTHTFAATASEIGGREKQQKFLKQVGPA